MLRNGAVVENSTVFMHLFGSRSYSVFFKNTINTKNKAGKPKMCVKTVELV
jgi:hypothetical protein